MLNMFLKNLVYFSYNIIYKLKVKKKNLSRDFFLCTIPLVN